MDDVTDLVHAARRLYDLASECETESRYLMEHYHAGYVSDSVFDPVSSLSSARLMAEREAETLVRLGGDDNDLARADVIAEEISRLIRTLKPWRVFLDNVHRVKRT
jgi:hypothetical protein